MHGTPRGVPQGADGPHQTAQVARTSRRTTARAARIADGNLPSVKRASIRAGPLPPARPARRVESPRTCEAEHQRHDGERILGEERLRQWCDLGDDGAAYASG